MGKKLCVLKKNKLYVYEVKTNLKFYKIKEKILKNGGQHINGIYNFNINELDYYTNNEEVKIDGYYAFIEEKELLHVGNYVKMFYKGIKYPDILNEALLLRDGDISNIEKLNEYRLPLYIKNMKESRKKKRLLEDYPYDQYIDEIMNSFSLKQIDCIPYSNMEDLVKKIEKVTKYNNSLDPGDKDLFNTAKKAELSMFIPDDYGDEMSGISRLKKMLSEHERIYSIFKERTI